MSVNRASVRQLRTDDESVTDDLSSDCSDAVEVGPGADLLLVVGTYFGLPAITETIEEEDEG